MGKERKVDIPHPEKLLFPDDGISKQDLADYFSRIAVSMLPYIKDRPITLRRFPDGIHENGFFNKHAPEYFPEFIRRAEVPMRTTPGKNMEMVVADDKEDLVYFAGQDTIEIHLSISRVDALEKPDQIIFDLDPSDDDFEKVRRTAFALKDLLGERDIPCFVKTTGSRGLHIHIPIYPESNFDQVKPVALKLARELNHLEPDLTTLEHRIDQRGDLVFIDYLRNDYGMTAIAPYSPRALMGAPVATPIDWEELKNPELVPGSYSVSNIFRRLEQKADPWVEFRKNGISVTQYL